MRSVGPIEDRLETALRYDVLNGSRDERLILACQIDEAIEELRRLRRLAREGDAPKSPEEIESSVRQMLADPAIKRDVREFAKTISPTAEDLSRRIGAAPKEERCHVWGGDVSRWELPGFAPTGNAGDPARGDFMTMLKKSLEETIEISIANLNEAFQVSDFRQVGIALYFASDEAGLGQQMRITTKDFEDFFDDEVAK